MIIDNMGMLSSVYGYADIAWVGGAFGKGLHNILEAAVFGIPVMFGSPKYTKFKEAKDLIRLKAAFAISTEFEAVKVIAQLLENEIFRTDSGKAGAEYCKNNSGATLEVMTGITRFAEQNV
jgi:3-deoxy-D-manno-octulosonic-acid transferase